MLSGHSKTATYSITVLYPYHPLVGQRFRPVFVNQKPRRSFRVQLPERRLTIPAWMTEEPAASFPLREAPCVAVDALLDLASLLDHVRRDPTSACGRMPENSVAGEDQVDGQEAEATASGGGGRRRRAATRSRRKSSKGHGEIGSAGAPDGTSAGSRRAGEGGRR